MNMNSEPKPPHGNQVYPWSEWEKGQSQVAVQGVDFACDVEHFRSALFQRASRIGKKVWTRVRGTTVTFRFYDPAEEPETTTADR